ncbi:MAG: dTDP-4-dehydrorhamnose reductase [Bacteroidales bacterium]
MEIHILVTGADGQLGSEIKKNSGKFRNFNFEYTDVQNLDITDLNALQKFFSSRNFKYIINAAAYTAVDRAESEKEKAFKINAEAVKNLFEIAVNLNIRLIHISTDYVFDSVNQNFPISETVKPSSSSIYGSSKLEGENVLRDSANSIIIRTSWLYSEYGNNIVKTILKLGKEREQLNFVYDQVGTPTYAGDLAEAILKIIDVSETENVFFHGVYHYSNEGVCSWYDFATAVVKYSGLSCKVKPIETKDYPLPAKRPNYSVLNKSKIKETFKIEIPHWQESLKKCLGELEL